MHHKNKSLSLLSVVALGAVAATQASAATLDDIGNSGEIRCGVNAGLTGFSAPDEDGRWSGIDADFCRAVAAATLGDAESVAFTPLTAKERFTALQSGEVDVLSRNTTWTATRDNSLGLNFTGVTFYDGQAFMVSKDLGVSSLDELNGATICIQSGTTHELNIADYFPANDLDYQLVTFDTPDQTAQGFGSGRCDVLTSDSSQLAALRLQLDEPDSAMILPERISKEPLGPVVRQGDSQWFNVVKWTLFAMINAEEMGVTQDNVDEMRDNPPNPNVARLLGQDGNYGEQMGLDSDWAYNIVKQVGNYAEVYDRNVGADSPLGIDRGINALWSDGGIQYAPPVR
ncbi:amino acid ABC transporter substrate-binding protein [Salinicola aestuarinus]|uniref:amino acid ABC transporter substrate-binding protein n=1 Tax=Salinicola aestuarinus TaxID=1949082 RepID=UPI000DA17553|nr:amino acid ABC transporter substrate-binding protein [Salinicola aestuarinus]